jgi:hypothetical protein
MKIYKFELQDEDSLVVIDCKVRHHNFSLAVDTGASHTVIDLTALLMIGFTLNDVVRTVQLETGKGVIDAYVFKLNQFTTLDKTIQNMEVCAYDFIANAIFSDFDGVLGLDFFRNSELIINFKNYTIQLR